VHRLVENNIIIISGIEMRRQLTLFIGEAEGKSIEKIRKKYNPRQYDLIQSHVTLCREDEIEDFDRVLANLTALNAKAITIRFEQATRIGNGDGVLLPASEGNEEFHELRKQILKGLSGSLRHVAPHITLMHPRNSICTDEIFEQIQNARLPTELQFNTISLIGQINGGKWKIIKIFKLSE
jgi:hypothetical protein